MTIKYNDALEIAVGEYMGESWALTKTLIAECEQLRVELAKLKAEIAYFQAHMLDCDGAICACCEKVRHVDDMVRATEERHGVDGWFCSDDCADKTARMYEEHCDPGAEHEEFLQYKPWR